MGAKKRNAETEFNLDPRKEKPRLMLNIITPESQSPSTPTPQIKKKKDTKMNLQPGESMKEYSQRVEDFSRTAVNLAIRKTTKTKTKRQEKSKSFKRNIMLPGKRGDFDEGLDVLLERSIEDKVKFGEQAMAPPVFTVRPSVRAYMPKPRGY